MRRVVIPAELKGMISNKPNSNQSRQTVSCLLSRSLGEMKPQAADFEYSSVSPREPIHPQSLCLEDGIAFFCLRHPEAK